MLAYGHKGILKGEREVGLRITWISSVKGLSLGSLGGPWGGGNLRVALAPTLELQYPREYNMCYTSLWGGVGSIRAQGLKMKHSNTMYTEGWAVSYSVESKPWNCSPWVCVSWWCWKSHTGLRCHSEYCWSCLVDTGSGPARHGTFWSLLAASALDQVLNQSGGEDTC